MGCRAREFVIGSALLFLGKDRGTDGRIGHLLALLLHVVNSGHYSNPPFGPVPALESVDCPPEVLNCSWVGAACMTPEAVSASTPDWFCALSNTDSGSA